LKQELETAIAAVVHGLFALDVAIELSRPDDAHGDYATNVAMQLAGRLSRPPREVAEQLSEALQAAMADTVATVSVAGPGFLNLTLKDTALASMLTGEAAQIWANKVVLTEYSDPNPFKPLHAGHLYTTLVGDVIARLFEVSGGMVTRLNYGGDVGLHVGKSMWAISRAIGEDVSKLDEIALEDRPKWLGERYVEGNNAYEDDEASKAEIIAANRRVYEIQAADDHDSAFAHIYWTCRQWSYDYFVTLYDQLQVKQFDRVIPESEIVPLGLQTVRDNIGDVYQESEGAIVFKGEEYGLHTRVFINSQGLPTYEAKDVGLLMTKWRDYAFDYSLVITANEQQQYMEVMLKSVELFAPEPASRSGHVTHGMVKLKGGEKMSSRKGNIVGALDILEAAYSANRAAGNQDNADVVTGAVKYAFLKQRIGGDISYDPLESISLEGNSGPYLQYAHARARSILRKAASQDQADLLNTEFEQAERVLLRKLTEYIEVVDTAVATLMPHHICGYLYELSQCFNRFYEHNRVIDDPRQSVRLSLVTAYADTLRVGLQLLGIVAPDQM
jgi:arginyl-tRNA synthetase